MVKDTASSKIKLPQLVEEIRHSDTVLDNTQQAMPDDFELYQHIVEARDAVFRLLQEIRGCKVIEFGWSGLDDLVAVTLESFEDEED